MVAPGIALHTPRFVPPCTAKLVDPATGFLTRKLMLVGPTMACSINTLVWAVAAVLPKNNKAKPRRACHVRRQLASEAEKTPPGSESFMIRVVLRSANCAA